MATVLVGAYASDPSTIWPEKYSSCFWNFVTGWTCQTVEAPVSEPAPEEPQPLGNTPDPNANPIMFSPVSGVAGGGSRCGCCGGNGAISPISGAPIIPGVVTETGKKCAGCKCGYTNREAMLAVAVALVFFLLIRK